MIELLRNIVSIPSYSKEEDAVADFLCNYLQGQGLTFKRFKNNIVLHKSSKDKKSGGVLLNSHIDTVKPAGGYTFDPHNPPISDEKVYGLGSNDAGGCVVSLIETFKYFQNVELPFDLGLILSAEEECSGADGLVSLGEYIKENFDMAIIGEPTSLCGAIAERGLLVIDGCAKGVTGHAARNEGVNAIEIALEDLTKIRNFKFEKVSPTMGEIKLSITQINAGTQHNVIPDTCNFVIDIRTTEKYTNSEIVDLLQRETKSTLKGRNLTNRSSATPVESPLMKAVHECGIATYISPTTSDWMKLPVPAIKMGPGESSRSHQSNEFIYIKELEDGVKNYIQFINALAQTITNGKQ